MQTLATLMALAVMSYTFPIIASATVNIAFIACNWILHFFAVTITYGIGFHISVYTGGDLQFPVDPFAQFILAATIGYLCKINKRSTLDKAHHIQEETRLQTQLLSQQRNLRLASHLHDEVANGIAAIAAIAHAQDDPQWRDVARKADATFDASHELIRLLYTPDDHTAQDQAPSWESIVAEERNRLRAQGVDGYCDVAVGDAASQLTADQTAELIGLIREVFTNIGKHGKIAETGYVFRLFAQGNRIELVAMNDAADSPNPHARGHGLLLHDSILSDMGGTLTTTLDDGTWIVHAVMPLPTNRR